MADLNHPCLACEIAAGRAAPPGGVVARWPGFVLHGVAAESPVAGWVVLAPERHVRGVYDLSDAEAARMAVLSGHVQRVLRRALSADHVYAVALGDALHHAHLHLVPRTPALPERLRGARVFLAGPEDARPLAEIEEACAALARALEAEPPPA